MMAVTISPKIVRAFTDSASYSANKDKPTRPAAADVDFISSDSTLIVLSCRGPMRRPLTTWRPPRRRLPQPHALAFGDCDHHAAEIRIGILRVAGARLLKDRLDQIAVERRIVLIDGV